jgi:hypothetical protein
VENELLFFLVITRPTLPPKSPTTREFGNSSRDSQRGALLRSIVVVVVIVCYDLPSPLP